MLYKEAVWVHSNPKQRVFIYSEINDESWETRKVEIWADGKTQYTSGELIGTTGLSDQRIQAMEYLSSLPHLRVRELTKDEFEAVWAMALSKGNQGKPR